MPHVLVVTALELRHPVTLLVLMETDDEPLCGHLSASLRFDPGQRACTDPMLGRELPLPFAFNG
ncbi:MAG: hypothetical protein ACJ8AM_03170 [Gemmatimonadales bacterium]